MNEVAKGKYEDGKEDKSQDRAAGTPRMKSARWEEAIKETEEEVQCEEGGTRTAQLCP